MSRCLELALRGQGYVVPNPMVGCVIVHNGEVISEGWHKRFGEAHAEREAISKISGDPRLKESILYVNLEPCAHYGKTPPCADLIAECGIRHVVYGCKDPFASVNGKGLENLKENGVLVEGPVLEKECRFLNRRFFVFHEKKRPYIILKWAESTDGFIAPENRTKLQISGQSARMLLHKWRSQEAAVLVGSGTLLADNPKLDVRFWHGPNPLRIIFNAQLKGNLLTELPTIIFNSIKNGVEGDVEFIKSGAVNFIPDALKILYEKNIQSIIVEGGANTINEFISIECFDELRVIKSKNVKIGDGLPAPKVNITPDETLDLQDDFVNIIYRL